MILMQRKTRKLLVLVFAVLFLLIGASGANALIVSPQYDVNKYWNSIPAGVDPTDTSDSLMCWAATVSNVLMYTNWGYDVDGDGTVELYDDLYHYFLDNFDNTGGSGSMGYDPYVTDYWGAQLSTLGLTWQDFFHQENDDSVILQRVEEWLDLDYGIYLSITNNAGTPGHAITAWGYETDSDGDYTRIAVTDSDDHLSGLQWYNLHYNSTLHRWYMTDYGTDVYIRRIDAYAQNSVPDASIMLLLGSSLMGLAVFSRKSKRS